LWARLRRDALGWHFRRQHAIGAYVADFACIAARVVVELDGGQHAENQGDARRDGELTAGGWTVLRFWNTEVVENLDGVVEKIRSTCLERAPPPQPSPAMRERE
jgi:primosomal protein N' (replication factor Y)